MSSTLTTTGKFPIPTVSATARMLFLVFWFLVIGCVRESRQTSREVLDGAGKDSLSLVVARRSLPDHATVERFHALVWRKRAGVNWVEHRVITQNDFQAGNGRRRWVSDVHSLDAGKGTAVIKVAEYSRPMITSSNITVTTEYSWREWNLLTNGEIRVLRVCQDPLEKY